MAETLKSNPYAYAENNPTNKVDPTGRNALDCVLVGVYAIATLLLIAATIIVVIVVFLATPPPFNVGATYGAGLAGIAAIAFAIGATLQAANSCWNIWK